LKSDGTCAARNLLCCRHPQITRFESKQSMSPEIHWPAIALRLALTVLAGGLLGAERSRSGHAAGLRTTLLVTLAASVAMIQMNLLMQSNGKPPNSYAVMDLMRLPLGILTGVGFIGAGAIVRRNELVMGLTTAATLWFATVVGLCLGGGQVILGSSSTAIGWIVLHVLRRLESRFELYQTASLAVTVESDNGFMQELRTRLEAEGFRIKSMAVSREVKEGRARFALQVQWPAVHGATEVPPVIAELEKMPGLIEIEWRQTRSGPS
jgi:putative Mg2+ transporter-C (MgtC) family protein